MTPMTNISPLSYRDGTTYLHALEKLKQWLNQSLVPEFNDGIANAIAEFQAGLGNAETRIVESEAEYDALMAAARKYVDDSIQYINNKTGPHQIERVTITGPYTVTVNELWPSNHPVNLVLTQDGTGGHPVTWAGNINGTVAVGTAPGAETDFWLIPEGDGTWTPVVYITRAKLDTEITALNNSIATKASTTDMNTALNLKADKTALDATNTDVTALELSKADQTALDATNTNLATTNTNVTNLGTTKADKATNVSSSVPFRTIAGVIRNTGSGWEILDDAGHVPAGIDSVTSDGVSITVNYTSMGVTEVGAFAAVPDEGLARAGIIAGASVGLTQANIHLGKAGGYSDFVEYVAGTGWQSLNGVFSCSFTAGVLTLTHPDVHDDGVFDVTLTPRPGPTNSFIPSISREGAAVGVGHLKIEFRDAAGALQTANGDNMRLYVTHGGSHPLNPAAVNTVAYPGSNLFIMGLMKQ